jgi:hypothetical protein
MTATQEKWASRIAAWKTSGKSQREFTEAEGLSMSSFRWWSSQLRKMELGVTSSSTKPTKIGMARVVRAESRATRDTESRVFIEVAGTRITVERGFDGALLRAVVSTLGGAR